MTLTTVRGRGFANTRRQRATCNTRAARRSAFTFDDDFHRLIRRVRHSARQKRRGTQ